MFDRPRPTLNIRAIIRDMLDQQHDLLVALSQAFLKERLAEVEARRARWERHLSNHYTDSAPPPHGDAEQRQAYQIEQRLIEQFLQDAQSRPFVDIYLQRRDDAQQRVRRLTGQRDLADPTLKEERYRAWLEQELLVELWAKWRSWMNSRGTPNADH